MKELVISNKSDLVAIADAIRNKTGETEGMTLSDMPANINGITGGIDTSDATATASDIASDKTAYVKGEKVTGILTEAKNINDYHALAPYIDGEDDLCIWFDFGEKKIISGEHLWYDNAYSLLGTAEPEDVRAGVKFSSREGLAIEGTAQIGGISIPTTITAGDTPVLFSSTMAHTCTSTTATATGISITVPRAGTYRFKFSCARTNTSGTWTAQLRKNGTAVSSATATWNQYQGTYSGDIQCNANDKIEIYAQSRGTSYRLITGQLIACINWDTGF